MPNEQEYIIHAPILMFQRWTHRYQNRCYKNILLKKKNHFCTSVHTTSSSQLLIFFFQTDQTQYFDLEVHIFLLIIDIYIYTSGIFHKRNINFYLTITSFIKNPFSKSYQICIISW